MLPTNLLLSPAELATKRWYHFLSPRFWGIWLALGLLRLLSYLPYCLLLKIGNGLGKLFWFIFKKRRHITAINLKLCFPDLSEQERFELVKKNFASVGIGLLEAALAWWASDKRLRKMLEFKGLENLQFAKQQNKGVLFITAHFTSIELGLRLLSFATPIHVLYLPPKNLFFAWFLQHTRRHYIQHCIIQSDMRGLLKSLKGGHAVCYTPDQDKGRNSSVFAPFFGVNAATVRSTGKFLKHNQSIALPGLYSRDENRQKYTLTFLPPLEHFPTGDEIQDAIRINQTLEGMICQHPEQYMWQHRRFKTRPMGEASVY